MAKGKLSRQRFASLDDDAIRGMKNAELRSVLRGARQLYNQTSELFERNKERVYSHAYNKMQDYYDDNPQKAVSRMKQSELRKEVFRLNDFFNAKTSTIKGAKEVSRETDIRIYGVDERGRAKHRMKPEESKAFWDIYDEFKNMVEESRFRNYGSTQVQLHLGEMMKDAEKKDDSMFNMETFSKLRARLDGMKEKDMWEFTNYERRNYKVYSGTRNDR